MQIAASYLILWPLPTWRRPEVSEAHPFQRPIDIYLNRYFRDGAVSGTAAHTITPFHTPAPALAGVGGALCSWPATPATATCTLVPLPGLELSEFIRHTTQEIQQWRTAVVRALFPCDDHEYIDRAFFSILYLEPSEPLVEAGAQRAECELAMRRLRSTLRQDNSVALPQRFQDLFVCHGAGIQTVDFDLVAVRVSPLPVDGLHDPRIAESVLRLGHLSVLVHRLRSNTSAITAHPILRETPLAYVSRLLGVPLDRAASIRWLSDAKAASAYAHHMTARLEGIGAKDSARALASEYQAAIATLKANAAVHDDSWVWATSTFSDSPHRRGVVDDLHRRLAQAGEGIASTAADLAVRDQAISDYLRDYLNAAVARSNLVLQRIVLRLTIVAIVLAVLSLLK